MEKAIERAQMLVNHLLPEQHTEVEKNMENLTLNQTSALGKKRSQ